ncbi:MAG: hypothetical protein Q9191_003827 [Dirinaria sp. TL-2023a]
MDQTLTLLARKYRDELRPRQGLLRGREFLMKDLYTFDMTNEAALATYDTVRQAYNLFFDDLKIPYVVAAADSGSIGGDLSHEYHALSEHGEDTVICCRKCGYAINEELDSAKEHSRCPKCSDTSMKAAKAIELGHTFHLSTRYSKPLGLAIAPQPSESSSTISAQVQKIPLQMGCHGIGISRMIAAVAAIYADRKGLNWPRRMAPFEVAIVPGKRHMLETPLVSEALNGRSRLEPLVDVAIDDRDKEFGWKLNDADLIGYPIIVIMGRKWAKMRTCEVQCRRLEVKEDVHIDELGARVRELLNKL